MKVALCLSGEPRNLDYIWNDLEKKLNIPGNDIDIYIHTWYSNDKISSLPLFKDRGGLIYQKHLNQLTSPEYIYKLKPRTFLVENYYTSPPHLRFCEYSLSATITRMYSMFYGIQCSTRLAINNNFNSYDYIIRMRPDIFLEKELDWNEISILLDQNPNSIVIPELWINIGGTSGVWTPMSDYWPDFMCIYKPCNRLFENIYDDIQDVCGLHVDRSISTYGDLASIPEHYLASYAKNKGITSIKIDIKMMLARHHKQITSGEQIC
jgi:hypothetical protein